MLDEQKAFIESIRADERAKLARDFTQIGELLTKCLAKLSAMEKRDGVPNEAVQKSARKPRTAKLDEGVVNAILIPLAEDFGQSKAEIEAASRITGRQLGNYLVNLEKQGRIIKSGKGKTTLYKLTPAEGPSSDLTQSPA